MYRIKLLSSSLLGAALLVLLLPRLEAGAGTSWLSVNRTVVDNHLVPRYEQLAKSSAALSESASLFCAAQNEGNLAALRDAYHRAMDDWMGIQHMRFGPVTMYLRYNRFQIWPDKHGTGSKQLRRLLASENREVLNARSFAETSVAIQGFPTLERLLFPAQLNLADFGSPGNPSYRCDLIVAIGDNLWKMSAGIVRDWGPGDADFREQILGAEMGNDYFESSEEVSSRLLNNLHTQLQSIVDQKLLRPLERFQLRRAESWRSRRSLRNILLNLEATRELYETGFSPVLTDKTLDREIREAFSSAMESVQAFPVPLYETVKDSEHHQSLKRVLEKTSDLKRLVAARLPSALGLSLGFNSLDGD